jgi:hypothetical protein
VPLFGTFLAVGGLVIAVWESRRIRALRRTERTAETVEALVWARAWLCVALLNLGLGLFIVVRG